MLKVSMAVSLLLVSVVAAPAVAGQKAAPPPQAPDAGYYFLLGRHLEGEGKIEEAIASHKRAIALDPKSAELHAANPSYAPIVPEGDFRILGTVIEVRRSLEPRAP